ncbi:hypothetical protein ABKN59_011163 [Abortiporus biennis]
MSPGTTSPLNENPTIPTQLGRKPSRDFPRDLFVTEIFWRNLQPWLESKGYMLRPRYKPDWKPSWKEGEYEWNHEDACINAQRAVIDATRISDGEMVMLKKLNRTLRTIVFHYWICLRFLRVYTSCTTVILLIGMQWT